jgi:CBS domain-containing protein
MNAVSLLSQDIVPLMTSNTGREALEIMSEYYVQHLPIVNNKQLLGVISEEDIINHDVEEPIGSYDLSLKRSFARETDHIFDLLSQISRLKLSIIPVIDDEENYVGMISLQAILAHFANSFSFAEPGSILVLEMTKPNYSMSDIARIIESENTTILHSFITQLPDINQIQVHIKINKMDGQRIIAALERFEYKIKAFYTEREDADILKDRLESFMNYLSV